MVLTDLLLFGVSLSLSMVVNILYVALGLGLVIFFHELGHFAVAKWCNVNVERFSIGFGPILWSYKRGETEYALSLIPFGGYVKMLGQDDMDPSQLTSEEIAQDPRAYSSKTVLQRMAIISAGVIMNVITGMLFYATAFGLGFDENPATVGQTRVGMPAWKAGIQPGSKITSINGRAIESFMDITRAVALSSGDIEIDWVDRDGKSHKATVTPDGRGTRRIIGAGPGLGTTLIKPPEGSGISETIPGTPAAAAKPAFAPGDMIKRVDEVAIPDFSTLQELLAKRRDREVVIHVQRDGAAEGELTEIKVGRNPFRILGLSMEIGEIAAVRDGSPAQRKGIALQPGDKITEVDGKPLGTVLNPLRLPDLFEEKCRKREMVEIKVLRKGGAKEPETVTLQFEKNDPVLSAWLETPGAPGVPLSVPSLGIAIHIIPTVLNVQAGSPADIAKIKKQELIKKLVLSLPDGAEPDGFNKNESYEITIRDKDKNGNPQQNWAFAFWMVQSLRTRTITLTVADATGNERTVDIQPADSPDWNLPFRGIRPDAEYEFLQASDPLSAMRMGFNRARDAMSDVYLTITSLFGGRLSYKELSGPVKIAEVAYHVADQGIPKLLLFLGFLSINLAVLNFLPIPVLDGGHMVFLIWEGVTRRKPSEKVMIAATYVGLALILGLMGLVLYLDIFVN